VQHSVLYAEKTLARSAVIVLPILTAVTLVIILTTTSRTSLLISFGSHLNLPRQFKFPVVFSTNIRGGLCSKIDEMSVLFTDNCIDIGVLTETLLQHGISDDLIHISGYLWSPYVIGQTIIFSSCSFFPSFYLLLSFFSLPNLSGRRLDVYHTLAHGVALVRI